MVFVEFGIGGSANVAGDVIAEAAAAVVVKHERFAARVFEIEAVHIGGELRFQLVRDALLGGVQRAFHQFALDFVVEHADVHFFVVIDAVEFPFVGGVGVLKDANRAVGGDGVDVVARLRRAQRLQGGFVIGVVAARAKQHGQRAARAGAVADDFFGVARHGGVVVAQVTHRRFEVDDGGGRFAGRAGAAARAGRGDDVAFGECGLHRVRALLFAVFVFARHARFGGHVAADLVRQEDGCGGGAIAVDAAAVEVGFRDVDVDLLVVGLNGLVDVGDAFVGAVGDGSAVYFGGFRRVFVGGEVEAVRLGEVGKAHGGKDGGFFHGWLRGGFREAR